MAKPYVASRDGRRRGDEFKWLGEHVPLALWGKDHWSTLLYIETCVVDHSGRVEWPRMRSDGTTHPTRLGDGTPLLWNKGRKLVGHSDWDCAEDFEREGLLENVGTGANPVYKLTDAGWKLAHGLRRARAESATKAFIEDLQRRAAAIGDDQK